MIAMIAMIAINKQLWGQKVHDMMYVESRVDYQHFKSGIKVYLWNILNASKSFVDALGHPVTSFFIQKKCYFLDLFFCTYLNFWTKFIIDRSRSRFISRSAKRQSGHKMQNMSHLAPR